MATATRIASDGKPIEVTDIPYGLSEKAGIRNSIKLPVMARDISRAGTGRSMFCRSTSSPTTRTATASR